MVYVANVYQGDHVAATDLQNIENNFEYLRTNFKAGSAPPDPGGGLEGVIWWDSTKKTFKGRSDTEWRGIFSGAASFKIWAYLETVPDGWTRDTTVSDEVLSFKGGSTYTTGATRNKGSWAISGLTKDAHTHPGPLHNHQWLNETNTNADDQTYNSGGSAVDIGGGTDKAGGATRKHIQVQSDGPTQEGNENLVDSYTNNAGTGNTGAQSDAGVTSDATWRIKAAVGIMLYPKM